VRPVSVSTHITAPREDVFDFLADLANRPAIADHFAEDFRLARVRSDGVGAAARYRVRPPGLRGRAYVEIQITESDRPRHLLEAGRTRRLGRTPLWSLYELSRDGGATRVDLTLWSEPATRLDSFKEAFGARRWSARQARTMLERLRLVFEERPPGELARATIAGWEPATHPRFGT
jgi:hypothetical protein